MVKGERRSPAKVKELNRPKTLRQWSDQFMVGAMEAIQEGRMGVNHCSLASLGLLSRTELLEESSMAPRVAQSLT